MQSEPEFGAIVPLRIDAGDIVHVYFRPETDRCPENHIDGILTLLTLSRLVYNRAVRMFAPPCVLIVEDSYVILEMLRMICDQSGIRVLEASSGEAALTILRRSGVEIDWLLTDIALPGLIDGWDVAEAFRNAYPDRPVIYASVAAPSGGRPVSMSLFVRKPFQIQEMREIAQGMIAAAAERRQLAA